ncbi:MAG: hypothetical protein ABH851_00690 [Methanobacteriota archaeon]
MKPVNGNSSCRGQAAIEFILTYAWVILIVVVVLVLVWQLGLFQLGGNIEPGYMGFWGVVPSDFRLSESGDLNISFANYIGANVTIESIAANHSDVDILVSPSVVVEPGEHEVVDISGFNAGNGGGRFEILLSVDYTDSRTGNLHKSSGRIWGSYEEA